MTAEREKWLAWRREGIGASDVAAIVGLSRWGSPVSVYLEKTSGVSAEQTEPMAWGLLLEDVILDEWVRRRDDGLEVPPGTRQALAFRPDAPHHRATLDGIAFAGDTPRGIVEVKNVGTRWDSGDVPDYYQIQAQWQIHVTDLEAGWIVALHTGNRLESYPIERDQKTIDLLVERVDAFWTDHVLAERMPPADDSEATLRALKDAYPDTTTGKAREVGEGVLEALRRRREAKSEIKALEATVREAESAVRAALGDAEEGVIDGRTVVTLKKIEVEEQIRAGYEYRRLHVKTKELDE